MRANPLPQLNFTEQTPRTASSVRSVLILEVFAGSARISQACLAYGFQVIPVDSASAPGMRNLVLDLRNVAEQILPPPCGTSSRAREVPVDPASGLPPSRPLRSERFPDWLPDLYPTSAARVRSANELYAFTAVLIEAAQDIGSLWVVEQPLRSLAWHTSWLAPHVRKGVMNETHFCAFGGQRLKRTGLLSDRQLPALVRQCAGDHPHLPWRGAEGSRTAEETAYPPSFCERVAAFCLAEAEARGFQPVPASLALPGSSADFGFLRTQLLASLGQQRRGLQAPAVPSAYEAVVTAVDVVGTTLPKGTVLAHVQPNDDTFSCTK